MLSFQRPSPDVRLRDTDDVRQSDVRLHDTDDGRHRYNNKAYRLKLLPLGLTLVSVEAFVIFCLLVCLAVALFMAGIRRGEEKTLKRLSAILVSAKVIPAPGKGQSGEGLHRDAARQLNTLAADSSSVMGTLPRQNSFKPAKLEAVPEAETGAIPKQPLKKAVPATPTRTYSLRHFPKFGAQPSGSNCLSLIDLDNILPAKPEDPSLWV